jgi:hypothetical protein
MTALRVVGRVVAFFGCLATLGALLGMVAFR